MKRVIRSSLILGMAFPMSVAKDKLTADAKQLNDHIMKCVIYGDSLSCLNHWIDDEITTWIYKASTISCKHRISPNVYKSTLFCWFGEDSRDAESNLYDFYTKYVMRRKNIQNLKLTDIQQKDSIRFIEKQKKKSSTCFVIDTITAKKITTKF